MNEDDVKGIIAYCGYCTDPIYEGEGYVCDDEGCYYHFDKRNRYLNCYFSEVEENNGE